MNTTELLVRKVREHYQAAYSLQYRFFKNKSPEIFSEIVSFLSDAIVVDVGGANASIIREMSRKGHAKMYINLDPLNSANEPNDAFERKIVGKIEDFFLDVTFKKILNDIDFNAHKKVFFLNGLDFRILNDKPKGFSNWEYYFEKLVADMISFSKKNGGYVVGVGSPDFCEALQKYVQKNIVDSSVELIEDPGSEKDGFFVLRINPKIARVVNSQKS